MRDLKKYAGIFPAFYACYDEAGAAFAAVPILIVFVIFQKYFTKGITMGAVKG